MSSPPKPIGADIPNVNNNNNNNNCANNNSDARSSQTSEAVNSQPSPSSVANSPLPIHYNNRNNNNTATAAVAPNLLVRQHQQQVVQQQQYQQYMLSQSQTSLNQQQHLNNSTTAPVTLDPHKLPMSRITKMFRKRRDLIELVQEKICQVDSSMREKPGLSIAESRLTQNGRWHIEDPRVGFFNEMDFDQERQEDDRNDQRTMSDGIAAHGSNNNNNTSKASNASMGQQARISSSSPSNNVTGGGASSSPASSPTMRMLAKSGTYDRQKDPRYRQNAPPPTTTTTTTTTVASPNNNNNTKQEGLANESHEIENNNNATEDAHQIEPQLAFFRNRLANPCRDLPSGHYRKHMLLGRGSYGETWLVEYIPQHEQVINHDRNLCPRMLPSQKQLQQQQQCRILLQQKQQQRAMTPPAARKTSSAASEHIAAIVAKHQQQQQQQKQQNNNNNQNPQPQQQQGNQPTAALAMFQPPPVATNINDDIIVRTDSGTPQNISFGLSGSMNQGNNVALGQIMTSNNTNTNISSQQHNINTNDSQRNQREGSQSADVSARLPPGAVLVTRGQQAKLAKELALNKQKVMVQTASESAKGSINSGAFNASPDGYTNPNNNSNQLIISSLSPSKQPVVCEASGNMNTNNNNNNTNNNNAAALLSGGSVVTTVATTNNSKACHHQPTLIGSPENVLNLTGLIVSLNNTKNSNNNQRPRGQSSSSIQNFSPNHNNINNSHHQNHEQRIRGSSVKANVDDRAASHVLGVKSTNNNNSTSEKVNASDNNNNNNNNNVAYGGNGSSIDDPSTSPQFQTQHNQQSSFKSGASDQAKGSSDNAAASGRKPNISGDSEDTTILQNGNNIRQVSSGVVEADSSLRSTSQQQDKHLKTSEEKSQSQQVQQQSVQYHTILSCKRPKQLRLLGPEALGVYNVTDPISQETVATVACQQRPLPTTTIANSPGNNNRNAFSAAAMISGGQNASSPPSLRSFGSPNATSQTNANNNNNTNQNNNSKINTSSSSSQHHNVQNNGTNNNNNNNNNPSNNSMSPTENMGAMSSRQSSQQQLKTLVDKPQQRKSISIVIDGHSSDNFHNNNNNYQQFKIGTVDGAGSSEEVHSGGGSNASVPDSSTKSRNNSNIQQREKSPPSTLKRSNSAPPPRIVRKYVVASCTPELNSDGSQKWKPTSAPGIVSALASTKKTISLSNGISLAADRVYVCKTILRDPSKGSLRQTIDEINILSSCAHPCILSFIESFVQEDRLHVITEYMDFGDLEVELRKRKTHNKHFSESTVWFLFVQLCLAVEYLHRHNILHRDLKSANVLLSRLWLVKLCDFGFAKFTGEDDVDGNVSTSRLGTPYYMAPEIWLAKPYSAACDCWSLGVLLYELFTLNTPFVSKSYSELCRLVTTAEYAPIQREGISPAGIDLINKLLVVDPKKRLTAKQLLLEPVVHQTLQQFLGKFERASAASSSPFDRIWFQVLRDHAELVTHDRNLSSTKSRRAERSRRNASERRSASMRLASSQVSTHRGGGGASGLRMGSSVSSSGRSFHRPGSSMSQNLVQFHSPAGIIQQRQPQFSHQQQRNNASPNNNNNNAVDVIAWTPSSVGSMPIHEQDNNNNGGRRFI